MLTVSLIAISVMITLFSNFGNDRSVTPMFLISNYAGAGLPELRAGQWWRLVSPIFVHFSVLHILFNMLWLWDLGGAIEREYGSVKLGVFTFSIGALSNLAQYLATGPGFGGMSGVVFALLGYIWMQGRYNPSSRLALQRNIVIMMVVWYVLCWTGLLGQIANIAHTAGLVLGTAWGFADAKRSRF